MDLGSIFQAHRFTTELSTIKPRSIGRSQVACVKAIGLGENLHLMARDARIVDLQQRHISIRIRTAATYDNARRIDLKALDRRRSCPHHKCSTMEPFIGTAKPAS